MVIANCLINIIQLAQGELLKQGVHFQVDSGLAQSAMRSAFHVENYFQAGKSPMKLFQQNMQELFADETTPGSAITTPVEKNMAAGVRKLRKLAARKLSPEKIWSELELPETDIVLRTQSAYADFCERKKDLLPAGGYGSVLLGTIRSFYHNFNERELVRKQTGVLCESTHR